MNARLVCAAALTALSLLTPLHASAAEFHVVYSGTITAGFDIGNVFGLSGQNLAGLGLRADVTYLTSVPGTRATDATSDEVAGGGAFGTDPIISSAVFTVGSTSFTIAPSYYGDVYTSAAFLDAYGYDLLGNSFQTYILPNVAGPVNLELPFYSEGVGDAGGAASQYSYLIAGADDIDFSPTSVAVSAAPESATWAMMLLGFGALGCTIRRRTRNSTSPILL